MARFKPGDTIANGEITVTIAWIGKHSYSTIGGAFLPINLVDRFWVLVDELGEIIDE